jgi:hypothetical protein
MITAEFTTLRSGHVPATNMKMQTKDYIPEHHESDNKGLEQHLEVDIL